MEVWNTGNMRTLLSGKGLGMTEQEARKRLEHVRGRLASAKGWAHCSMGEVRRQAQQIRAWEKEEQDLMHVIVDSKPEE